MEAASVGGLFYFRAERPAGAIVHDNQGHDLSYRTVIKFQKANNLPATGYLGPLTRASINSQAH
jgi:hypothetical protein